MCLDASLKMARQEAAQNLIDVTLTCYAVATTWTNILKVDRTKALVHGAPNHDIGKPTGFTFPQNLIAEEHPVPLLISPVNMVICLLHMLLSIT